MTDKLVICNNASKCDEADMCGGAVPHVKQNECGACPFHTNAECVPVKEPDIVMNNDG